LQPVKINEGVSQSYQRDGQTWVAWDGQQSGLKVAISDVTLPVLMEEVLIFEGLLKGLPGEYVIYVGYRLKEGRIIFNGGEPLQLNVK